MSHFQKWYKDSQDLVDYSRPLAENIVALCISPREPLGDRWDASSDLSPEVIDREMTREVAPNFTYNSEVYDDTRDDDDFPDHELPPLVKIAMISIDETSALRLDAKFGSRPYNEAGDRPGSAILLAYLGVDADIINLLVGPLAEAMYVAKRDGELINPYLINLNALHNYGGASDLALVNEYLECLLISREQREKKIVELFMAAYKFVSIWSHWRAIIGLANYILISRKPVIECEEAMSVLDKHLYDKSIVITL